MTTKESEQEPFVIEMELFMRIAICSLLVAILAFPLTSQAADAPLAPRVFPHPDRIRYDSQCFAIEGKDTFIFSGAFHYFRCPKELWNDRFDKIKAAGFDVTTGNGFLYLNDHPLGQYWQVGPQHDFFLPECWLSFGPGKSNVLTICLRSVDGKPITITSAAIVPVNEVAEFRP